VTLRDEEPAQEMGAAARLHADETLGKIESEVQQLLTREALLYDDLSSWSRATR
jgi:hypothetical protein